VKVGDSADFFNAMALFDGLLDLPIARIRFIYFQNWTWGCYCALRSPLRCEKSLPSWSLWEADRWVLVPRIAHRGTGGGVESHDDVFGLPDW